jgi:TRAP-type transport system periplasmic protein
MIVRFGGYQKPASIHNRAAAFFGELLKKSLGDAIEFVLIGSILDELGRPSGALPDMVATGELSFCYMSTVRFTQALPQFAILELPYVVKDRAAAYDTFDGVYGDLMKRQLAANSPFRLLGIWDNGFRHLSNRVRPIRKPEDCRGLRIRTQLSALQGESFRALGFEPVAVDIKDFTESIASDRFDAQDNPLTNIYNFGVHNHHPYITLTGHFFGASLMICNQAEYQSWPPAARAAVEAAALEATAYQRHLAAAEDADMMNKLNTGNARLIQLSEREREAFIAALRPVTDRHRKDFDPRLFRLLQS